MQTCYTKIVFQAILVKEFCGFPRLRNTFRVCTQMPRCTACLLYSPPKRNFTFSALNQHSQSRQYILIMQLSRHIIQHHSKLKLNAKLLSSTAHTNSKFLITPLYLLRSHSAFIKRTSGQCPVTFSVIFFLFLPCM